MTARTRTVILILAFAWATAAAQESAVGDAAAPSTGVSEPESQKKEKSAEIRRIADDLAKRDRTNLTESQRRRRDASIRMLREYADRAVFTINDRFPGKAIPYFIDDRGTRCQLAYVMEMTGAVDLLASLAREQNNAYVAQIVATEELRNWLTSVGLTEEEIAYIQAPGLQRPPRDRTPPPTPRPTSPPAVRPNTGASAPIGVPVVASGGGRKVDSSAPTWSEIWDDHGDRLGRLREQYNAGAARVIATDGDAATIRDRRVDAAQRRAIVESLRALYAKAPDIRSTLLVAMSMASIDSDRSRVSIEARLFLADANARDRFGGFVALGMLGDRTAAGILAAIVADESMGQSALGESGSIGDDLRAHAALALGRSRSDEAPEVLRKLLLKSASLSPDLATAALIGLALSARDRLDETATTQFLLERLVDPKMDQSVRNFVPAALAIAESRTAAASLGAILSKFEGSSQMRQSAAAALGMLMNGLEPDFARILMKTGMRDPDPAARAAAIIALGEAAAAHQAIDDESKVDPIVDDVATFLADGAALLFKQKIDRPWYLLASGLFASRFPDRSGKMIEAMLAAVANGGAADDRGSAALGLGMVAGTDVVKPLRELFRESRDVVVRSAAVEALAMRKDDETKAEIVRLALESDDVRLRARASRALAYYGDVALVDGLIAELADAKQDGVRAALTKTIGAIGDRGSIDALMEIVGEKTRSKETRERAAAAIALALREESNPYYWVIRRAVGPLSAPPAVATLASIL